LTKMSAQKKDGEKKKGCKNINHTKHFVPTGTEGGVGESFKSKLGKSKEKNGWG